jgi:hypothetical protein
MLPARVLTKQVLAALFGPLAYAAAVWAWFFIGCAKVYTSCTYDLSHLPAISVVVAGAGLATHVITSLTALMFGGVSRMQLIAAAGLYAVVAFLLMGLWMVLTGPQGVTDYWQFAMTLLPFLVAGAALGAVVWFFLRQGSNSTPHTDARANSVLHQPPSARAGERGR